MSGGMWRQNIDLPEIMAKICALVVREKEGDEKPTERRIWVLQSQTLRVAWGSTVWDV